MKISRCAAVEYLVRPLDRIVFSVSFNPIARFNGIVAGVDPDLFVLQALVIVTHALRMMGTPLLLSRFRYRSLTNEGPLSLARMIRSPASLLCILRVSQGYT